ncbi:response regulator [Aquiflexum sp.]|uniref:response regulator n=1 Tax=Aquiflexum sp. TaxID=1872584 RepID=UPI003593AB40
MRTKIIIADDHEMFASGLKQILNTNPNYHLGNCFSNGKQVLDYLDQGYSADLLILDLNMPVMDGVQVMGHLQRNYPNVKKLVLSMHRTVSTVELCKNLGADGMIGKDAPLQVLLESIQSIIKGGIYFNDLPVGNDNIEDDGFYKKLAKQYHLSKRETEVLQLIINQFETDEIAEKLNLSRFTVRTHRRNIFEKLGVRNLAGLVTFLKKSTDF